LSASHAATHCSAVASVYAQSLLELAAEAGQLDAVDGEARQLAGLVESQEALRWLLGGRLLTEQKRRAIVDEVFRGRVSDLLYRFLQVVAHKNRLEHLRDILRLLPRMVEERQGITEVEVTTATGLSEAEAAQLAESLCRVLGRKVVARQRVDESLVGGLKLRVGARLLEGAGAAQLRGMARALVETGREQSRSHLGELIGT